jgi:curved DNA-binding protein
MSLKYKDYYEILGLPRTASDQDIKKAFRKLARQYHPDVAKSTRGAEDKFKEINEAYEVLGDPTRRRRYDQLGANWKPGTDFRPAGSGFQEFRNGKPFNRNQAPDFEFDDGVNSGFSDFFEQVFGARGTDHGTFRGGSRFDEVDMAEKGKDVQGDIYVNLEEVAKGAVRSINISHKQECAACRGNGDINGRACNSCSGTGQVKKTHTFNVKIPVGVTQGQRLRIPAAGDEGLNGGQPGDAYVTVHIHSHPEFEVSGQDLIYETEISPAEAVMGTHLIIPTLTGEVNIRIPAGTQPGQKLRVRGRGMINANGGAGDLYVVTLVRIPDKLSDEESRLWARLAELNQQEAMSL